VAIGTLAFTAGGLVLDILMLYIARPGQADMGGECQVGVADFDLSHWMLFFAFVVLTVRILTTWHAVIHKFERFKHWRPEGICNQEQTHTHRHKHVATRINPCRWISEILEIIRALMIILQFVVMMAGLLIYVLFKFKVLDECDKTDTTWVVFEVYILLLWATIIVFFAIEIGKRYWKKVWQWRDAKEYPFHYLI